MAECSGPFTHPFMQSSELTRGAVAARCAGPAPPHPPTPMPALQMPKGVPVATVAIGNAANAGLLAVRIIAASDPALQVGEAL